MSNGHHHNELMKMADDTADSFWSYYCERSHMMANLTYKEKEFMQFYYEDYIGKNAEKAQKLEECLEADKKQRDGYGSGGVNWGAVVATF